MHRKEIITQQIDPGHQESIKVFQGFSTRILPLWLEEEQVRDQEIRFKKQFVHDLAAKASKLSSKIKDLETKIASAGK